MSENRADLIDRLGSVAVDALTTIAEAHAAILDLRAATK